jgi:hypothetical protein
MNITPTPEHCESCGSEDYEDLNCGDQGYTACCNEGTCNGQGLRRFATAADYDFATPRAGEVRACCSHRADVEATRLGLVVTHRID